MSVLLEVLLDLWLGAGIICFILGSISAILRGRGASALHLLVLPFYLVWMSPIYLAIYFVVAIWWLWEKLFKSGGK